MGHQVQLRQILILQKLIMQKNDAFDFLKWVRMTMEQ